MNDKEFMLLETTATGNVFPVGSVVNLNGEQVFWRDITPSKFLFRKGNYEAIYQDECLIDYIKTTPVKTMIFHSGKGKAWQIGVDAFESAKTVNMRGRKQKGVSLVKFNEVNFDELPTTRRPKNTKVIN